MRTGAGKALTAALAIALEETPYLGVAFVGEFLVTMFGGPHNGAHGSPST
jgi:hypothetical protein